MIEHYETAKRQRMTKQINTKTRYGNFRMVVGAESQEKEIEENLTEDFWSGDWLQNVPVGIRNRLTRKRWLDIGAGTGWFAFKLASSLSVKVISSYEVNENAFSYIRHNHLSNHNVGIVSTHFCMPVAERPSNTHTGEVRVNEDGYMDINGEHTAEVPIEAFADLLVKNRYNALRFNMNGYEKEFLLKGDLSKVEIIFAKLDSRHYTEKELTRLMKKMDKRYPEGTQKILNSNESIFIWHSITK